MNKKLNYLAGNKHLFLLGVTVLGIVIILVILAAHKGERSQNMSAQINKGKMQLVSQVFRNGSQIPPQYTCKGQNVNPPLNISAVPKNAKSLALIMHDPDAVGSDFTHWIVYDMPASTASIAANSVPVGALQGLNSSGEVAYTGPCPPAGTGTHHYKFELYALDKTLGLGGNVSRGQLESAMNGHTIDHFVLTGLFSAD